MGTAIKYAAIFFVISMIAGGLGFSGISEKTAGIAKIFFFIALAIAIFFVIAGVTFMKAVT